MSFADDPIRPLPHHVAVIGAAGGLGQGILDVCRAEGIGFTAIVRSLRERITNVPRGVINGKSPKYTSCVLVLPVTLLISLALTYRGAS